MEESLLLQAGATFALLAALTAYVALQRPRTALHRPVLALLAGLLAWTSGEILIFGSHLDPLASRLGTIVVFSGVMATPPLWLFLCARVAGWTAVVDRPQAALAALFTPALLNFAVLVTDAHHGLFAGGETAAMFTDPVATWAGPLFWVHAAWSFFCTGGGILICLGAARHSADAIGRKRLLLVAAAAAVPMLNIGIIVTGLLPGVQRLTPADLGVSAVLLVAAIVRYRFLESSPLPASMVISHLSDTLVLANAEGIVVDANPAAERLFGVSVDELRGRPLDTVIHLLEPDDGIGSRLETPETRDSVTESIVGRDGRVLDLCSERVTDAGGRATGRLLVVRDRTEQHQRERSRDRIQRLESLGVIAAGIAHEINNPLAFVRTNLGHLMQLARLVEKRLPAFGKEEADELAEMEEIILEIQAGVDRISRIVEGTRGLSRESRRVRELVDLNAVVEDALRLAELHANHNVPVTTALSPAPPKTWGSAEQLGRVLLNLLINAKQAAGRRLDGRIHVETQAHRGLVEVHVHDNGPGVPLEARERIFDPFFTTKGPDEGTGLGLAIAFEIANEHGGALEVGSSELGGARFTLRLPRSEAEPR